VIDRRDALRLGAVAAAAGALGLFPRVSGAASPTVPVDVSGPGHVVKVHLPGMRRGPFPDPAAARLMVDAAVTSLAGETDPGRAWLRFVGPRDRVGIKVNCLGTRMASTMPEVTTAIADAIRSVGVPDANIVVFDMFGSNMAGGRYVADDHWPRGPLLLSAGWGAASSSASPAGRRCPRPSPR